MATRSVIAAPYENECGWAGVYCHHDGYPSWNGVELMTIILRDGPKKAAETIVMSKKDWSCIKNNSESSHIGHGALEEGYGIYYTDTDPSNNSFYTKETVESSCDIEYVYIIRQDHLEINKVERGGNIAHLENIPYDLDMKDTYALCMKAHDKVYTSH